MSENYSYKDEDLSIGQQSLWLLHNCAADKSIYNSHFAWKIPHELRLGELKEALQFIVDRHPLLRTNFVETDDRVVQRVFDKSDLRFEEIEINDMSDEELSSTLVNEEFLKPFSLEKETAMRWTLLSRPDGSRVLILVFHHIIVDMGSFMIIANELRDIYKALLSDKEIQLPPLEQDYFDFIRKQNEFLRTPEGRAQEQYWRNQLENHDSTLDLPVDFKRPNNIECTVGYLNKFIPNEVTNKFNQFAADNDLSLFSLYIATYHLLLHKYTNSEDILVGTPTGGKEGDFSGVFGYFTNPVIVRSMIDSKQPILDFFKAMDKQVKQAIKLQAYPLSRVAEKLNLNRSTSKAALFQTSFTWQNINAFENRDEPMVTWDHEGRRFWDFGEAGIWERFNRRQQLDDLDLTFKIYKFKNEFHLGIEYNENLFKPDSIERMAEHFQRLMQAIAANPDCLISELSIFSEAEYEKIVNAWNATSVDYDNTHTFTEIFESQAAAKPDAIALETREQKLSYRTLNQQANQLAHYLIDKGVKPETVVGISLDRSPEMIIAVMAILKAGGAYLPLDPDYPETRLAFMVEDTQTPLVITSAKHKAKYASMNTSVLDLDHLQKALQSFSSENPVKTVNENSLAYIIYTSGSTGKPKGVQIEHSSLMNLTVTQDQIYDLDEKDKVLLFASLNFDTSIFSIVLALQKGVTLYVADKESLLGENLEKLIIEKELTWALLPPPVAHLLNPDKIPMMKSVMIGGEACSADLAKAWHPGRQFLHGYGPTETTVWATVTPVDGSINPPIGKPVANTQTYILDKHFKPVPIGVPGELCIGGDCVARGYLNRPELTAERFIPDPFSNKANARLYRSGDLVRYLPDGNIEFLGRIDHQIKIRGFRVELGEIESSISSYPSVDNVLVMARDDMMGSGKSEPLLAAYIITQNSNFDLDELRSFLKQKLPDYMIPSGFVTLDAFPLTPNEKIDRKALPIPQLGGAKSRSEHQVPRNEIEKTIASIWQNVLNLEDVSTDENFFDLGGHSLLLAQVYSQFPSNLKSKLSMVDLFKFPTIKMLAKHLEQNQVEEEQFFLEQDEHIDRMRLRRRAMENIRGLKIAIVGMSGRFPGAETVDEFWQNIAGKEESIRFFSDEELLADGLDKNLIGKANYVKAKGAIRNPKGFDADFFAYTPREAQITDPQQRLFLECSYEALEDGGCVPETFKGKIGVYAGTGINNYMMNHISANPSVVNAMGDYPVMIGNDKDFLSNRVSYKLNLNGPAMVIQTACSTSLVAVHSACQALINEECDAALAGAFL